MTLECERSWILLTSARNFVLKSSRSTCLFIVLVTLVLPQSPIDPWSEQQKLILSVIQVRIKKPRSQQVYFFWGPSPWYGIAAEHSAHSNIILSTCKLHYNYMRVTENNFMHKKAMRNMHRLKKAIKFWSEKWNSPGWSKYFMDVTKGKICLLRYT